MKEANVIGTSVLFRFCIWLACCLISITSYAGSPVWKVSKGEQYLYVGGTIHMLASSDYPLPDAFERAYTASSKLVFETDISQLNSPELQRYIAGKVAFQDGRTLRQALKPETFKLLEQHLQAQGVPVESVLGLRPGMVSVTLTLMELQRLGMAGTGVDEFFHQKAISDGKALGELETAMSQIDFLADLGKGYEDELILHTLEEVKMIPQLMADTKRAWRTGQLSQLEPLMIEPMVENYPELYQTLLVNRNNLWMPQIYQMLEDDTVEFILVGALHLVGKDGLLDQLEANGYSVERLK